MDEVERFLEHLRVEQGMSEHTLESYSRELVRLRNFLGGKPWAKVSTEELRGYLSELLELGLSPRSVFHHLAVIRSFYRFLLLEEMVDSDPSENLEFPKLAKKLPQVLSEEEVKKLLGLDSSGEKEPEGSGKE